MSEGRKGREGEERRKRKESGSEVAWGRTERDSQALEGGKLDINDTTVRDRHESSYNKRNVNIERFGPVPNKTGETTKLEGTKETSEAGSSHTQEHARDRRRVSGALVKKTSREQRVSGVLLPFARGHLSTSEEGK